MRIRDRITLSKRMEEIKECFEIITKCRYFVRIIDGSHPDYKLSIIDFNETISIFRLFVDSQGFDNVRAQ